LIPRRFAASSFQVLTGFLTAFFSSGLPAGLCSVPLTFATAGAGAATAAGAFGASAGLKAAAWR
jgi:hypothetical protein